MANWQPLGSEEMLQDGQMEEVEVAGKRVLLARVAGSYYANQLLCTHLRANLSEGTLEDFIVTCPRHSSQFDVRDGHNVAWVAGLPSLVQTATKAVMKPRDLQHYETKVEDGQVWVSVS